MADYAALERQFAETLVLGRRPIAVAYRSEAPPAVQKFSGSTPSGCSFWRLAAAGGAFYTVPADHFNCPIGSYTHSIPLPADREKDLTDTLGLMTTIGYVRMEEVPSIARLEQPPGVVIYAPLAQTPVEPDAVIFSGKASGIMLLNEAAQRAGVSSSLPFLSRPTCMAIPAAMKSGMVISGGCIGNRVYTDIGEDELYAVAPGTALEKLAAELSVVGSANAQLAEYHHQRRHTLASA